MRLELSFPLITLLAAGALSGFPVWELLVSVLVHEAGHIAAALLLKKKVGDFTLNLKGVGFKMTGNGNFSTYETILINASGPLAGLLTALVSDYLGLGTLKRINLWLSLFNLLPFKGLDGGEMFSAIKNRTP